MIKLSPAENIDALAPVPSDNEFQLAGLLKVRSPLEYHVFWADNLKVANTKPRIAIAKVWRFFFMGMGSGVNFIVQ